jgi:hypothetical protein
VALGAGVAVASGLGDAVVSGCGELTTTGDGLALPHPAARLAIHSNIESLRITFMISPAFSRFALIFGQQ